MITFNRYDFSSHDFCNTAFRHKAFRRAAFRHTVFITRLFAAHHRVARTSVCTSHRRFRFEGKIRKITLNSITVVGNPVKARFVRPFLRPPATVPRHPSLHRRLLLGDIFRDSELPVRRRSGARKDVGAVDGADEEIAGDKAFLGATLYTDYRLRKRRGRHFLFFRRAPTEGSLSLAVPCSVRFAAFGGVFKPPARGRLLMGVRGQITAAFRSFELSPKW